MMQINFSTVARQEQVLSYLNTFVSDGEGHFLPCVGVAEAVEVKYCTVLCQYFLLLPLVQFIHLDYFGMDNPLL